MNTRVFEQLSQEILDIMSRSPVPEDLPHALNTKEWVKRLFPAADYMLQLAALAHDLERALPQKKVKKEKYPDYESFKQAHAQNSARLLEQIISGADLSSREKEQIFFLVKHHEFGHKDHPETLLLRDADALSFFEINLLYFASRHKEEETLARVKWGYCRLSERAKPYLARLARRQQPLLVWLKKINTPILKIYV
jgi:hypothetical protein